MVYSTLISDTALKYICRFCQWNVKTEQMKTDERFKALQSITVNAVWEMQLFAGC